MTVSVLLYTITRTFFDFQLLVHFAKITTHLDQVSVGLLLDQLPSSKNSGRLVLGRGPSSVAGTH